ncbi:hypothetical protein AJ87_34025 [Rhizobium yanglingense]|nr:hypothetical protein AJ87_34025 [Rhizobium yanglingense]
MQWDAFDRTWRQMKPIVGCTVIRDINVYGLRKAIGLQLKGPVPAIFYRLHIDRGIVKRLRPSEREMECFGKQPAIDRAQPRDGYVMGRWTETESIGRVEKCTEELGRGEPFGGSWRKYQCLAAADGSLLAVSQADDFKLNRQAFPGFVDDMHVKAVRALVRQQHLNRAEGAAHGKPNRFRLTGGIDSAPTGTRQNILKRPDKSTVAV